MYEFYNFSEVSLGVLKNARSTQTIELNTHIAFNTLGTVPLVINTFIIDLMDKGLGRLADLNS